MRIPLLLVMVASSAGLADEPTCSVTLTDAGDQKINIIKIVREYTLLGLKDAKELVEAPKPKLIREGLTRTECDALVTALTAKGAKAEAHQKGAHGPAHPKAVVADATFDVKLESWGENKIMVIKIVRDRTGLGLAETKKLVESAPIVVVKGLSRPLAESMLHDLTAVGAKASLLPQP